MAKKKGKKRKKKSKATFENADIDQKRFLRAYANLCEIDESPQSIWLKKAMLQAIEVKQYVTKFLIYDENEEKDDEEEEEKKKISLEPVIKAIRETFYPHLSELIVWDLDIPHRIVAALALFLEKRFRVERMELMDCEISAYSVGRLAQAFTLTVLTHINLDYNEFGDEGCKLLCEGCLENKTIVSVSMCYCKLTYMSGEHLAPVLNGCRLCELYLDGNLLECEGLILMLTLLSDAAEHDHERRLEDERLKQLMIAEGALQATDREMTTQMEATSSGEENIEVKGDEKKKKKKKKKRGKKEAKSVVAGPYIDVLHLADNGVDLYNNGGPHRTLTPCLTVLQRLIAHSDRLRELDLSRNSLGEIASREIAVALEERKEAKLPAMKLSVNADVSKETFKLIRSLAGGVAKKKKKGKRKKKKKK